MRLGVIGCGSIGSVVVRAVAEGRLAEINPAGIVDLAGNEAVKSLTTSLGCPFCCDVEALLSLKPDMVLEAASAGAARSFALSVLESGAALMMVGVAAPAG